MTTTMLHPTRPSPAARRLRLAAIAALILLVVSACASGGASGGLDKDLRGTAFASLRVEGHQLVAGTQVTIRFTQDSLTASAGCNTMSASAATDADALIVGDLAITEMGCDESRHTQDDWLLAFLSSAPTFARASTTLTVRSGDVAIVFDEVQPEPIDAGTWVLDGLITGDLASSLPRGVSAHLTFTGGRAEYGLGCNSGSATVTITPAPEPGTGTIEFTDGVSTLMMCDPDSMAVEHHLAALYSATVDYRTAGTNLTLLGADIGATYSLAK